MVDFGVDAVEQAVTEEDNAVMVGLKCNIGEVDACQ